MSNHDSKRGHWSMRLNGPKPNHNKTQQSATHVHDSLGKLHLTVRRWLSYLNHIAYEIAWVKRSDIPRNIPQCRFWLNE